MPYYLSRQWNTYTGELYVEIAAGGRNYSNPGELEAKFRALGENEEYDDPRNAVRAGIAVRDAWEAIAELNEEQPFIEVRHGHTGGSTSFFEAEGYETKEASDAAITAWAKKKSEMLPKCSECGGILGKQTYRLQDEDETFCSSACAEAYELEQDIAMGRRCVQCHNTVDDDSVTGTDGTRYCDEGCRSYHEMNALRMHAPMSKPWYSLLACATANRVADYASKEIDLNVYFGWLKTTTGHYALGLIRAILQRVDELGEDDYASDEAVQCANYHIYQHLKRADIPPFDSHDQVRAFVRNAEMVMRRCDYDIDRATLVGINYYLQALCEGVSVEA